MSGAAVVLGYHNRRGEFYFRSNRDIRTYHSQLHQDCLRSSVGMPLVCASPAVCGSLLSVRRINSMPW